jgi:hypothetical protein
LDLIVYKINNQLKGYSNLRRWKVKYKLVMYLLIKGLCLLLKAENLQYKVHLICNGEKFYKDLSKY